MNDIPAMGNGLELGADKSKSDARSPKYQYVEESPRRPRVRSRGGEAEEAEEAKDEAHEPEAKAECEEYPEGPDRAEEENFEARSPKVEVYDKGGTDPREASSRSCYY